MEKCDKCGAELHIGDFPFCPHGSTLSYAPFAAFETTDDSGRPVLIDSMHKLRSYESETMKRWQAGEKVSPTVFRQFSQDSTNREKGVFGRGPAYDAEAARVHKLHEKQREIRQYIESQKRR